MQYKVCRNCQRICPMMSSYCPSCDKPLSHPDSYDVTELDPDSQDEQELDERRLNHLLFNLGGVR